MKQLTIASFGIFILAALLFTYTMVQRVYGTDAQGPVISMPQDFITVGVDATEQDLLAGITAADGKDGDVTNSLMVESLSNFITTGERQITVAAFDSDNHVSKVTRRVIYTNYIPPQFSLSAPLRFPEGINAKRITANLKAEDCMDGTITNRILRYPAHGTTLNAAVAGLYPVTFSVSNSAGAVEKFTATVEIYTAASEAVRPKITLRNYLIYLKRGQPFEPLQQLESLVLENVLYTITPEGVLECPADKKAQEQDMRTPVRTYETDKIALDNRVNTEQPGWYEVTYTVEDEMENTKSVRLLVCVQE